MSRTLVVVRHAKSSWRTNESDLNRPLSSRGTRDAVVVGHQLAPLDLDLVIVSPAVRAQQTWQTLRMAGARAAAERTEDVLYHGGAREIIDVLHTVPATAQRVLLIGHEPALSDLVLTLSVSTPHTKRLSQKFPTAGVAILSHDQDWDDLDGGLARLEAFEVLRG